MKNYIHINHETQDNYFYKSFFRLHGLDSEYTPAVSNIESLHADITAAVDKNCSGFIIGRPFNQAVIKYLDLVDQSVSIYNSCNLIVVKNNQLVGFNSELAGMIHVARHIGKKDNVSILGNGRMGRMFEKFTGMTDSRNITVYSRSLGNWDQRHSENNVIINCTTVGSDVDSPLDMIPAGTSVVIDMSTGATKLSKQCTDQNVKYVIGRDFYKYQFMMQYQLLTGITIKSAEYDKIAGEGN